MLENKNLQIEQVVAFDKNHGIGLNQTMPWHLPEDLKHFKEVTMGYPIIMGRKTFDSIGRALPGRRNIVLSRSMQAKENIEVYSSLEEALSLFENEKVMIIGGGQLYLQSLEICNKLHITRIDKEFHVDTYYLDSYKKSFKLVDSQEFYSEKLQCNYFFETWEK